MTVFRDSTNQESYSIHKSSETSSKLFRIFTNSFMTYMGVLLFILSCKYWGNRCALIIHGHHLFVNTYHS